MVDSQLCRPQVPDRLDCMDWLMTVHVQLDWFIKSVRFVRVFEQSSIHKCMDFNYRLSEHTQGPMSSDEQGSTIRTVNTTVHCYGKVTV